MAVERPFSSTGQRGWFYLIKYTLTVMMVIMIFDVILDFIPLHRNEEIPKGHIVVLSLTLVYLLVGFLAVLKERFVLAMAYAILMTVGAITSLFVLTSTFDSAQIIASYTLVAIVNSLAYIFAGILFQLEQ